MIVLYITVFIRYVIYIGDLINIIFLFFKGGRSGPTLGLRE